MGFILAIDNKVAVTVKGNLPGANRNSPTRFDFTLFMDRMEQEEIENALKSSDPVIDFVLAHTQDWQSQRLVRNEDDSSAEFSPDAFRVMLRIPGMAVFIFQAYLHDMGVQAKN